MHAYWKSGGVWKVLTTKTFACMQESNQNKPQSPILFYNVKMAHACIIGCLAIGIYLASKEEIKTNCMHLADN